MQQNQCLALFQRRRSCDDVFSTLADEFGDFGAIFVTALKKPSNWLQKTWRYIRLSQSVFVIFDDEFLKKKRRKYDLDCFLLPDFLGYRIL